MSDNSEDETKNKKIRKLLPLVAENAHFVGITLDTDGEPIKFPFDFCKYINKLAISLPTYRWINLSNLASLDSNVQFELKFKSAVVIENLILKTKIFLSEIILIIIILLGSIFLKAIGFFQKELIFIVLLTLI